MAGPLSLPLNVLQGKNGYWSCGIGVTVQQACSCGVMARIWECAVVSFNRIMDSTLHEFGG